MISNGDNIRHRGRRRREDEVAEERDSARRRVPGDKHQPRRREESESSRLSLERRARDQRTTSRRSSRRYHRGIRRDERSSSAAGAHRNDERDAEYRQRRRGRTRSPSYDSSSTRHSSRRRRRSKRRMEESPGRYDDHRRKRRDSIDSGRRDRGEESNRSRASRHRRRKRYRRHSYSDESSYEDSRKSPAEVSVDLDDPRAPTSNKALPPSSTMRSSSGRDDSVGHFRGGPGTIIAGRYRVTRDVGLGTFGRVVECCALRRRPRSSHQQRDQNPRSTRQDGDNNSYVAIKVVRNIKRYYESALIEARILREVNRRGGRGLTHCVILHDSFTFDGHFCMVFECLGPSLYDFLKKHNYRPFPMVCIQDFAVQLLEMLEFIHSFQLIHTDLKLENILTISDREVLYANQYVPASTRIKVIDFGGATFDSDKKSLIINTRQYRGPEVILETGWSMPSDVWSLGCILAELYRGDLLFGTHDDIEHLALMERIISPFPVWMLRKARDVGNSSLVREAVDSKTNRHRVEGILSPASASYVRKAPPLEAMIHRPHDDWFLDLLRRLLVIDPQERSTAHEALRFLSRIGRNVVRNA